MILCDMYKKLIIGNKEHFRGHSISFHEFVTCFVFHINNK